MNETTKAKVQRLPLSSKFTVEQALQTTLNEAPNLSAVMIIAEYDDDDLYVLTSRMSRKDALWNLERAKHHCLHGQEE